MRLASPIRRRSLAVTLLGALTLCSVAATIVDEFQGSTLAPGWQVLQQGMGIRQKDGQLQFSAPGEGVTVPIIAAIANDAYTLSWDSDWSMEFSYALHPPAPSPGVLSGVMALMVIPDAIDGQVIVPMVYRSSQGYFLGLASQDDSAGVVIEPICKAPPSGTLRVSYTVSNHSLTWSVNGRGARRPLRLILGTNYPDPIGFWAIGALTVDPTGQYRFANGMSINAFSAWGPGVVANP